MSECSDYPLRGVADSSGLITDLITFPRSPIDFRFHVVTARIHESYESCLSESVARCVASGVSDDPRLAIATAVGEAWERIAFVSAIQELEREPQSLRPGGGSAEHLFHLPFLLNRSTDRRAWAQQALNSPVKTKRYTVYSERQSPFQQELPAVVLAPMDHSSLFETTNGLACAESFDVALDRAVRELVERDALMLVWLGRSGGNRIPARRYLKQEYCKQINRMETLGIHTILRDITTDLGIRVFLVIIHAVFPGGRIGIGFGAGAHRDPGQAANHAFREACLSWRGVTWRALTGDRPSEDVLPNSFAAHSEYYSSWDRMHLLDFLLTDGPVTIEEPLLEDTAASSCDGGHVERLLEKGLTILATDITPPPAADAGLVIVQAVIPGLVPLYIGDRVADALAAERFPIPIGGVIQARPTAMNSNVHPWP